MIYQKHIFICINERVGSDRKSCGEEHGLALVSAFKKAIKGKDIKVKVRVQKCGCLDVCEQGPALVVYPEGVFYGSIQLKDVEEIVEEHIVGNRPVKRLVIG